ncbi:hypothetical protein KIW84_046054 [Lathyrus oleraceus]|uniref:Small EDRK-rich factor-like N-terminal domain-containing protein n=2 Tax=IRL clade TaxID=2233839 RepID=A0A9D4XPS2_PEA|nr:hypothetical protein KIW84_046054 [Pisum sativum]
MDKEKISIWQKHVLTPFTAYGKLLAFLGSYLTAKSQPGKVKNLFPCYHVTMPYVFEEHSLDLSYMEAPTHVFRYASSIQNKDERGNQREKDRERAQARANSKSKREKSDGLTPEQRRERDAKALQEKAARKAGQRAGGSNMGGGGGGDKN